MNTKRKHCLLICPKFYGYEIVILDELKKYFDFVDVIYENRDLVNLWHRFVCVYLPKTKQKVFDNFYLHAIKKISTDVDTVFVIRGSSLSANIMTYLKKIYGKTCRFIMYQWDGVKNNTDVLNIFNYFDSVYTFDLGDSEKFGWIYRPLFFDPNKISDKKKDIDIAYMCSLHTERAKILATIKDYCSKFDLKLFSNMYCNRFLYYKRKYISKKSESLTCNNKDVSFKSMSLNEIYNIYSRSKIVVDYTHPNQTGFTMRTIEALGNDCKLVTNNQLIRRADFYNPQNIYIYKGIDVTIPKDFIEKSYKKIDDSIYYYYSVDGWLNTILGE